MVCIAHQLLWFVLYNYLCCIPLPLQFFNFTPWKKLDLVNNHALFNVLGANYVSQVFVLPKSSLTFCQLVALVQSSALLDNHEELPFSYSKCCPLLSFPKPLTTSNKIYCLFRRSFVFSAISFSGTISYTTLKLYTIFEGLDIYGILLEKKHLSCPSGSQAFFLPLLCRKMRSAERIHAEFIIS